jgi:DNA-binding NtrC family response regulator
MTATAHPKHRVLFVDDEAHLLEALKLALHREPFECLTASSGDEALRLLEKTPVDVVVSDERMPGMPGSRLLANVSRLYPETIRIILTGQATLEAAIRAINEGEIYRFLLKPCPPPVVAQTIREGLAVRDLRNGSARLLAEAKERGRALMELERRHPGITAVARSAAGEVIIEPVTKDLETLVREIQRELDDGARKREAA